MQANAFRHAELFLESDLDRIRFRRQWLISSNRELPFAFKNSIPLSFGFSLHHHAELRLSHKRFGNGGVLVLGLAIDCSDPLADVADRFTAENVASVDSVARLVVGLAGTYVVICYGEDGIHILTDPMGMMGVYYKGDVAASTPALLPGLERDVELDRVFPFGGPNEWYTGSLVPFRGVSYLLANHYLELRSGVRRRFWPTKDFDSIDPEVGLDALATQLQAMVSGAVHRGNVVASLSGGKDSRTVLAASREFKDRIEYFTLFGGEFDPLDKERATKMAENEGLHHSLVRFTPPEPWLVRLYDEMTAGMVCGSARLVVESIRSNLASSTYIHMNGAAGEICSPFYWHTKNPKSVKMHALLRKHGSKPERIVESLREWLSSVEGLRPTSIYNLMFAEQIEGRWQGAGETASNIFYESFSPFCNREIVSIISGMPNELVYEDGIRKALIAKMWPSLLDIPFQKKGNPILKLIPRSIKHRIKYLINATHRRYVDSQAKLDS